MSTPESTPTQLQCYEQPYARVDLNPMPQSTLFPSQGLWIWSQVRTVMPGRIFPERGIPEHSFFLSYILLVLKGGPTFNNRWIYTVAVLGHPIIHILNIFTL